MTVASALQGLAMGHHGLSIHACMQAQIVSMGLQRPNTPTRPDGPRGLSWFPAQVPRMRCGGPVRSGQEQHVGGATSPMPMLYSYVLAVDPACGGASRLSLLINSTLHACIPVAVSTQ